MCLQALTPGLGSHITPCGGSTVYRRGYGGHVHALRYLLPTHEESVLYVVQWLLALFECLFHTIRPGEPLSLALLPACRRSRKAANT